MTENNAWHVLDVITDRKTPFRVVFVPGGVEGPNVARHPATDYRASVEWFDRRIPGLSGFVAAYYVSDLLGRQSGGLNLAGGVETWEVDADTFAVVSAWLWNLAGNGDL